MKEPTKIIAKKMLFSISLLFGIMVFFSCTKDDEETIADDTTGGEVILPEISAYPIVDTKQTIFYDNRHEISAPIQGAAFYGQEATYTGKQASYVDNRNGPQGDAIRIYNYVRLVRSI